MAGDPTALPDSRTARDAASGALDRHFASLLARLDPSAGPQVQLAARLAVRASRAGDVCVDLRRQAGRRLADLDADAPDIDAWRAALQRSAAVAAPGGFAPLVLDARDRLYLQRFWHYEDTLARWLIRASQRETGVDAERLRADLERVFPAPAAGIDWQRIAAAVAVLKPLAVICGGPGTGKTTTVLRVLALLALQAGAQRPRFALAAPTGKAAARLQQALREGRAALPVPPAVAAMIPDSVTTLHRLLGAQPDSGAFAWHAGRRLPVDAVIVDEASMVDLALMARLVDALPDDARLILLGDRDQLASVEAGAVLADICGEASPPSPAWAARIAAVAGGKVASAPGAPPLAECCVTLRHSHRFGADSGIARLAAAVNAGDADAALRTLESGGHADLAFCADAGAGAQAAIDASLQGYRGFIDAVRDGAGPAGTLAAFQRFRVLCAHRVGPRGVVAVNAGIEAALAAALGVPAGRAWYPGRPVIITRNSAELGLFNGDVGVALHGPDAGELQVWFESAAGGVRGFAPARLPEHEPAFALTVHKAQGSEFDEVLLLMPAEPSAVVTRELLYTALTRARRRVVMHAGAPVLRAAIRARVERSSGLRERLWP